MKRAVLYMRVSTLDQHPETQLHDLRQMASQRGYEIVREFTDRISGTKAKRPGLDQMMSDARHGRFDVVLVWASDRIARSVKHFLDVLDELSRLNIEYVSFRENIDTGGPLGRAIVIIIGAIAELERNLIIERVRAGMRRARLEGRHIGRNPLELDHAGIQRDRCQGQSLRQIAKGHRDLYSYRPARAPRARPNHPGARRMTEHLLVLLVCLAVIAVLAVLIYVASRGQISALTAVCELRQTLQQILANTEKIDRSLHDQRRVLYDAHKRISSVTKGV